MTINASGPCQTDGINVLTGQTSVGNTVSTSTTIPLEEHDQTGSNTILEEESVQDGINMLTNKTSVGSVVTTSTTIPLEEQDQTGSNTILEEEPVQVESPMTITASGPCQMDGINVLTGQTPVGNFITTSTTIPLEEDPKKIKSVSIQPEKRFKARKVRKQRGCADYNLAYMKLWWARMDREGKKTEEDSRIRIQEKKQSDRMISFLTDGKLSRKSKTEDLAEKTEKETPSKLLNLSKISMNNVRMKAEGLVYFADVLKERHLCKDTPTVDPVFITGRGGVKRTFSGDNFNFDDNSKKRRNLNNFEGGGGADIKTHSVDRAEITTCLKNTTPPARPITDQDLVIISNWTDTCTGLAEEIINYES